jgi:hypothetical protein
LLTDWVHGDQQEHDVKQLLRVALPFFKGTYYFKSVHAAALQPGRLAAWLEAAATMPVQECTQLLELFPALLNHKRPALEGYVPPEAPALVPAEQWKEGAVQLRREVRGGPPPSITLLHLL